MMESNLFRPQTTVFAMATAKTNRSTFVEDVMMHKMTHYLAILGLTPSFEKDKKGTKFT